MGRDERVVAKDYRSTESVWVHGVVELLTVSNADVGYVSVYL